MPQIAANEFCGDVSRQSNNSNNSNNNSNENVVSATFNDDFM